MNCFKLIPALFLMLCLNAALFAAPVRVKLGTVIPKGTTWAHYMDQFSQTVKEKTGGQADFKIYYGGVQGEEKDVIKKIRIGQLQAGCFTGFGIGEINPALRVLDAPFLFKNTKEIDYIFNKYDKQLRAMFEEKGYVMLGWTEVGFVYMLANEPIHKAEDLKPVKMWLWDGDPIAQGALTGLNMSLVPLAVADVMTSLQTGLIDGVYGSPLAVVSMQWFTKVKYMFSMPITNASGAIVIDKKTFGKLSPEHQQIVLDEGNKIFTKLNHASRLDNEKSKETLVKQGIIITEPANEAAKQEFEKLGAQARKKLAGHIYPKELLESIEKDLDAFRKQAK